MQYIGSFILGVIATILAGMAAIGIVACIAAGKAEKEKDEGHGQG